MKYFKFIRDVVFVLLFFSLGACVEDTTDTTTDTTSNSSSGSSSSGSTGSSSSTNTSTPTNPSASYSDLNNKNGAILSLPDGTHKWYLRHKAKSKFDGDTDLIRHVAFSLAAVDGALLDSTTENGAYPSDISMYVPTALGTSTCDSDTKMRLSIVGGSLAGSYSATTCTIDMQYVSLRGGLEGMVKTASFARQDGATLNLKDIPFRIYKHVGQPGSLATVPDAAFSVMNIGDTGSFELADNQYFLLDNPTSSGLGSSTKFGGVSPDDGTEAFRGNASDRIVLVGQFFSGFNLSNTLNCSTGFRGMTMNIFLGTYQNTLSYKSSNAGGSCTVQMTENNNGFYKATFSASLVTTDEKIPTSGRQVDISGQMKNYAIRAINAKNNGDEGELLSTEFGISYKITEGSAHFITNQQFKNIDSVTDKAFVQNSAIFLTSDQSDKAQNAGLNISYVPTQVGTYDCATDFNNIPAAARFSLNTGLGMVYNGTSGSYDSATKTFSYTNITGASCSITVSAVDV